MQLTDELGKRFLRVFIDKQDISILKKYGIQESSFFGDGLKGFQAALEYLDKYGRWINDKELFDVTALILPQADENLDHLADLLRKRTLMQHISPYLTRVDECIESRDPDKLLEVLREAAYDVRSHKEVEVSHYFETANDRLDLWLSDETRKEFEGIPTPWPTLNKAIGGWINGTLNVLTAVTNTGKTWYCCIISHAIAQQNKHTLFISMETPAARIERRLDALYTGIPFRAFRTKSFTDEQKDLLKAKLSNRPVDTELMVADKRLVRSVQDVVYLVKQFGPEAVVLDGGYLLEGRGKSNWESTVQTIKDLTEAAESNTIPFIVSTQQGEPESKKTQLSIWGVKYGKEWSINPDVVIGAFQNDDLRLIKASEIQIMKIRDSDDASSFDPFRINWNMETMDFSEPPRDDTAITTTPTVDY